MSILQQLLLLCSIAFIAFGDNVSTRIFGGHEATPGQFPHQISLRYFNIFGYAHTCGGSILNERFILTAAHCIRPRIRFYILVGAHNRSFIRDQKNLQQVKRGIVHPNYNQTSLVNDIALVELVNSLQFNARVQPIQLHEDFIGDGFNAIASGWGKSNVRNKILIIFMEKLYLRFIQVYCLLYISGFNYRS